MANPTFQRTVSQAAGSASTGGFALESGGNLADIKTAVEAIEAAVELLDNAILVDDAAFTPGTSSVQMSGFQFDDTATDSVDEGDAGAARMSANRNQYVMLGDGAGNERRANVNATNQLETSAAVTTGTGATDLGKAVDAVAGGTDTGVAMLAVRDDVLGGITPAAGDYSTFLLDANGALWTRDSVLGAALAGSELQVDVVGSLPAGTAAIGKLAANSGVDIGDVGIISAIPGTGATNLGKAEDAAHSSGDTGVMSLGVRNAILAALGGTDGDYVPFQMDDNGALYTVRGDHIDMVSVAGTQATATSTSIVASPGANKAILVLGASLQQNGASPTAQLVAIENGTGGAEKANFRLSANDGAGKVLDHPVILSTNNALHLDSDQAQSFAYSITYTIVDM